MTKTLSAFIADCESVHISILDIFLLSENIENMWNHKDLSTPILYCRKKMSTGHKTYDRGNSLTRLRIEEKKLLLNTKLGK